MKEYLRGPGETITALTDGDVEDELLDLDLPHGITQFPLGSLLFVNKNTNRIRKEFKIGGEIQWK